MNLRCLFLVKIEAIYGLLVYKTFGLKIGSCKFFDKSQVCKNTIRDEAALRNKLFTLLTLFTL